MSSTSRNRRRTRDRRPHRWGTRTPTNAYLQLRSHVLRRDGGACTLCGSRDRVSVDHIVPTAEGGLDAMTNLRTLCYSHHHDKNKRDARAGQQRARARGKRPPETHPLDRRESTASQKNTENK